MCCKEILPFIIKMAVYGLLLVS